MRPPTRALAPALVVLALAFDSLLLPGAGGAGIDGGAPLAAAHFRILPWLAARLLPPVAEPVLNLALHAAATVLVFHVAWLSSGSSAASLFAASLWAVSPEHARALASGEAGSVFPATVFALGSLALALAVRPRDDLSAVLYFLALLSHPGAAPLPLVVALARNRWPWQHGTALGVAYALRLALGPGLRLDATADASPDRLFRALGAGFDGVLPVGETAGVAVLALAAAVAVRRGPLPWRVGVWCAALVAFAMPWTVFAGDVPAPLPGAALLAVLPLTALAAEASRFARGLGPARVVAGVEGLLVAVYAVLGLARPALPTPERAAESLRPSRGRELAAGAGAADEVGVCRGLERASGRTFTTESWAGDDDAGRNP